ncbi:RluA family pseudouridine synthase [Reichenbachiella ulvae]|uniref:RluA family pseudouridine synthase n=1 Tax=Reichenbachiella ulvae TaxID=2980104 RepID=A0ABT3CQZ7_9BACT|nr:RluA family pseudouridine synthase [Reichenbachiella ulvae]MCV9386136.1 RluA family pseudouridine synthase [Reichenbachiella ulvae]
MKQKDSCFTYFKEDISGHSLPEQFTYPFYYEPHPLCLIAAHQLQEHLSSQTDWEHDFGLNGFVEGPNVGKMFGVLLVRNPEGEVGFLSAFSGKLAGESHHPGFVPPVSDILAVDSFYRKGEKEIMAINQERFDLEASKQYQEAIKAFQECLDESELQLGNKKAELKKAKEERKIRREEGKTGLNSEEFALLEKQLNDESSRLHFEWKDLKRHWKKVRDEKEHELSEIEGQIKALKKKSRERSNRLQREIFEQYQFLNRKGENRDLLDIFKETSLGVPPSGAGECSLPKLLQYAYLQDYEPLAMAEFWWGQSPKSEIRKHGFFYPSCKGKCEPILSHMLVGLDVAASPMQSISTSDKHLGIVYEDEDLLVINKPEEFLSVPGKNNMDSVYDRMAKQYPEATGPLMVHRLDRATSGLMLIAKNKDTHKVLQDQFLTKSIRKRYVAWLEGELSEEAGEIKLPLRVDLEDRPRQLVCYDHGKPAHTRWEVVERKEGRTKVFFYPITGRTHQLRVHAAHPDGLNAPIVGDDLYGQKDRRLHLHAERLTFIHPRTNQGMTFQVDPEF